jgi:hypothetical protein
MSSFSASVADCDSTLFAYVVFRGTDVTKPVLKKAPAKKKKAIRAATLHKQRIADENGRVRTVYRLDAGSGRFDIEFSKAFRLSVAKARKENKRLTGSPDVAGAKK